MILYSNRESWFLNISNRNNRIIISTSHRQTQHGPSVPNGAQLDRPRSSQSIISAGGGEAAAEEVPHALLYPVVVRHPSSSPLKRTSEIYAKKLAAVFNWVKGAEGAVGLVPLQPNAPVFILVAERNWRLNWCLTTGAEDERVAR